MQQNSVYDVLITVLYIIQDPFRYADMLYTLTYLYTLGRQDGYTPCRSESRQWVVCHSRAWTFFSQETYYCKFSVWKMLKTPNLNLKRFWFESNFEIPGLKKAKLKRII